MKIKWHHPKLTTKTQQKVLLAIRQYGERGKLPREKAAPNKRTWWADERNRNLIDWIRGGNPKHKDSALARLVKIGALLVPDKDGYAITPRGYAILGEIDDGEYEVSKDEERQLTRTRAKGVLRTMHLMRASVREYGFDAVILDDCETIIVAAGNIYKALGDTE